ncbi:MAG TPA: cyclic nucleotide-binding domain-containing protein [Methylocella sp.]|nr:cyclic nucleotide-binding domain-containing protein [Methylocella sp.]
MGLEDDVGKLARNPTFAVIEPEALRLIAFSADTLILRAGDVLFRRDELSNGGYVVLTGSIAMDASDHGAATARIVRPPGLIGDRALLTQTRRPATAIAREPSTVLRISQTLFHRVLQEFPASAERLRQSMSARLGEFLGELSTVRTAFGPDTPDDAQ